ncbi:MAG: MFS transporter, partial [Actinomycetota bacterium]|nr:MFS transporter [Actinomycetota bacterium]
MGWAPLVPLLCGTFVGTLNNNVMNAPLRLVVASLHVNVSSGALVVVSFPLALAVAMPLAGWLADRVGRKRLFVASVLALCATSVGASLAPDAAALVVLRVLQGMSSAAILPCVMGIVTDVYEPARRGRALGLWAAANGLGQTVGPPLGGLVASSIGWRFVFSPAIVVGIVAAV